MNPNQNDKANNDSQIWLTVACTLLSVFLLFRLVNQGNLFRNILIG